MSSFSFQEKKDLIQRQIEIYNKYLLLLDYVPYEINYIGEEVSKG